MVSEQQTSAPQSGAAKNAASNASISSSVSSASIVSTANRTNSFVVGAALVAVTVSPASSVKDKVMAVLGLTVGDISCVASAEM